MAYRKDKDAVANADNDQQDGETSEAMGNTSHLPSSGQDSSLSTQGACAQPNENSTLNETQPKSQFLDHLHVSHRGISTRPYSSVTGCPTLPLGPVLPGQLGDTSQDICLNDRITRPTPVCSTYMISPLSPPSMGLTSHAHTTPANQPPLQLNIPPSVPSDKVNNIDVPVGIAEGQLSFQEVPPSVSLPHALPPVDNPLSTMPQSTNSRITCSSGIEDDTTVSNASVRNALGSALMSARPVSEEGAAVQYRAGSSVLHHSESRHSLKSEISLDCQVRKLPKSILMFIAIEMKNSWEDLVELYGWNYHETQNFATKNPNDVFLALLKIAPFQTYTLSQFQEDLKFLPREDLLLDLDEKIKAHNAQALSNS
ncbi:hypothetical protein ElyMa_006815200 [Elysia marginata]|uniref:Uncharacterized protein n=1 Tax=Elysia marginata TaxID=1093978 RepID=A0AAV4J478_9GAST|nr:hypothetical protein ElyMa_006815200 [Elysia marginata]